MLTDHRRLALLAGAIAAAGTLATFAHLRRSVRQALEAPAPGRRELRFVSPPPSPLRIEHWGGPEVEAVAVTPAGLLTAGGSGVLSDGRTDVSQGLPTLKASALALWRGQPVVALAGGGFYRRGFGGWEEARSGWGRLHVRTLAESAAGELLMGAREGLFRAAWGGATLERLDAHPVRGFAQGAGFVLAGGEEGLYRVEASRAVALRTPDPWIESVAVDGHELLVVTASGLARGPEDGALAAVAGGEDVVAGVLHEGTFWGVTSPPAAAVRRRDPGGRLRQEVLPGLVRRLMTAEGTLFADTDRGLFRRTAKGWIPAAPGPQALPPGSSHVSALALLHSRLVAGFFDGGLAVAAPANGSLAWQRVPGSSAWGVNALLPAGGVLYVASLRGAARFDGTRLQAIEGPGAAFALAPTSEGVAIGYGQGVLLPGSRLLSAFHGLPGNQALALASGQSLFVGTPSGLGAVEGRRVRWRVTAGEGRLPHSWVTALAVSGDGLYVGTYGGGVARRTAGSGAGEAGGYDAFPETEGLKVSTGCLVEANGRIYAGTDGGGLFRLSLDRRRFQPLALPLPSARVTALLAVPGALYVGTDEGLARVPLPAGVESEE